MNAVQGRRLAMAGRSRRLGNGRLNKNWSEYRLSMFELENSMAYREDGRLVITSQTTHARCLEAIDEMMMVVVRSRKPVFKVIRDCGREKVGWTPLSRNLIHCMGTDVEAIKATFPYHRFTPYFTLFQELLAKSRLRPEFLSTENVDVFNNWVNTLREAAREDGFTKLIRDHKRAVQKNLRSLDGYLDSLHAARAKLLAVRLDLHYRRDVLSPIVQPDANSPDQVRKDREALLRRIKRTYPSLVGYIWKLEYGRICGYHYHLMLFFDGQSVREDITIGGAIAYMWDSAITKGRGYAWNCNAEKEYYEKIGILGIGMVHHADENKRENLRASARYLAKADHYMRLILPGATRTFGKGDSPSVAAVRRGRPRASLALPSND